MQFQYICGKNPKPETINFTKNNISNTEILNGLKKTPIYFVNTELMDVLSPPRMLTDPSIIKKKLSEIREFNGIPKKTILEVVFGVYKPQLTIVEIDKIKKCRKDPSIKFKGNIPSIFICNERICTKAEILYKEKDASPETIMTKIITENGLDVEYIHKILFSFIVYHELAHAIQNFAGFSFSTQISDYITESHANYIASLEFENKINHKNRVGRAICGEFIEKQPSEYQALYFWNTVFQYEKDVYTLNGDSIIKSIEKYNEHDLQNFNRYYGLLGNPSFNKLREVPNYNDSIDRLIIGSVVLLEEYNDFKIFYQETLNFEYIQNQGRKHKHEFSKVGHSPDWIEINSKTIPLINSLDSVKPISAWINNAFHVNEGELAGKRLSLETKIQAELLREILSLR